jgi:hypothetical protein
MASITIWHRLEPRSREASMERSLRAAMRDPLWLLARQDQLGEFYGTDAGSPVQATVVVASAPLTSYRPGTSGQAVDLSGVPLEAHVEREPVGASLRSSVQLGLFFERLLAGVPEPDDVVAQFRAAYRLPELSPALQDAAGERFRLAVGGDGPDPEPRVTDGEALVRAVERAWPAGLAEVDPMPALTLAQQAGVEPLLGELRSYRRSLYSEPIGDSAWDPFQLRYEFAVGSETQERQFGLESLDFGGGQLDWYSFDSGAPLRGPNTAAMEIRDLTFLPTQVRFRGMPNPRWWNLEDGLTDFGDLRPDKVDLAKLLVMEFALLGADDWFQLPLPLEIGTVNRVTSLVVADNFGERTLIRPTSAQAPDLERPWRMFMLSGASSAEDALLLTPVLASVTEGPDLEDVLFVRDELAALGWAIEEKLQGATDEPVSGYEAYFRRLALNPPTESAQTPGAPEIAYHVAAALPDNWIPLVPVRTSLRSFVFRRGVIGGPLGRPALARVLEPEHPYHVADEAVPKAGIEVTRGFRLARSSDGETYLWLGRRMRPGRGPGASSLRFDLVDRTRGTSG